jgi:diguanylate cyclase (GGDEF)-like protein
MKSAVTSMAGVESRHTADKSTARGFSALKIFIVRHRASIQDLSLLVGLFFLGLYVAFKFDVYANREGTTHQQIIELDEALTLGGFIAVGLLIFAARRYREQKRETLGRIIAEQQARELAFRDPLTGLANRRQFDDALRALIAAAPDVGGTHAVFLLDLNRFKQVNDVHGHGVGDDLLVTVSQRLLSSVREGDLVARLGGDEFTILARHLNGAEAATIIASRVIAALEEPIIAGSKKHQISVAIGIALVPGDAGTLQEALRQADVALYRAKAERRSAIRFFEAAMDRRIRERDELDRELSLAISRDLIRPYYQPVVNLRTRKVVGFEAVPRWIHPSLGEIAPQRFIPIAENNGAIHDLSERLLRHACGAAKRWPSEVALSFPLFQIQLGDRSLTSRIVSILEETEVAPSRLELEISEMVLFDDPEGATDTLVALREAGIKIVLANFGNRYSSLYHLRNLKLDRIKIDRGFVESFASNKESNEIVDALIGLAQSLGLTIDADSAANVNDGFLSGGAVPVEDTLAFFGEPSCEHHEAAIYAVVGTDRSTRAAIK